MSSITTETPQVSGKIVKASEENVLAACEQLFRAGEDITEANVRKLIGGGTRTVIYRWIHQWHAQHRDRHLQLEELAELVERDGASPPPEVPQALWDAVLPVWTGLLDEAKRHAAAGLQEAERSLARAQRDLAEDRQVVADADAAWKAERAEWSTRIGDLETELQAVVGQLQDAEREISVKAREAIQIAGERDAALSKSAELQEALSDTHRRHEEDQSRWAGQIDNARQDAAKAAQAFGKQVSELQQTEQQLRGSNADLRIELERAHARISALEMGEQRSQAEIERLAAALKTVGRPAAPKRAKKTAR